MAVVVGTNSYIDEAALTAYASLRGITLVKSPTALLILAMDYLAQYDGQWIGEKTDPLQALDWPRIIDGVSSTPSAIENAQAQLAVYADTTDLMPVIGVGSGGTMTSRSVGDVSFGYSSGYRNQSPLFPLVSGLLKPYLSPFTGGAVNFAVRRQ